VEIVELEMTGRNRARRKRLVVGGIELSMLLAYALTKEVFCDGVWLGILCSDLTQANENVVTKRRD
jgi:hypothetical protein